MTKKEETKMNNIIDTFYAQQSELSVDQYPKINFASLAGYYYYAITGDKQFISCYGDEVKRLASLIDEEHIDFSMARAVAEGIVTTLDWSMTAEQLKEAEQLLPDVVIRAIQMNSSGETMNINQIVDTLHHLLYTNGTLDKKLELFIEQKQLIEELFHYFTDEEWLYLGLKDCNKFFENQYALVMNDNPKKAIVSKTFMKWVLIAAVYQKHGLRVFNYNIEQYDRIVILDSVDCHMPYQQHILNVFNESGKLFAVRKDRKTKKWYGSDLKLNKLTVPALERVEDLIDGDLKVLTLTSTRAYRWNAMSDTLKMMNLAFNNQIEIYKQLEQKGELFEFLLKLGDFKCEEKDVYSISSVAGYTYGRIIFNLNEMTVRTNREFTLRNRTYVHGEGLLSGDILMAMMMTVVIRDYGNQGQRQEYVDAVLNELTQVWEEEDIYGKQLQKHSQLRIIRENTLSILSCVESHYFPYFRVANGNKGANLVECVNYLTKNNIPFFTDKTATKRIVMGAGITALFAAFVEDYSIFQTVLDTKKPGKLWTRGWQAVTIPADAGLEHQEGYRPHIENNLKCRHFNEDGSHLDINIEGDRRQTITGDLHFISNGSGVGYSFQPWAFSCMKTVRDRFEGTFIPDGMTREEVADNIKSSLEEYLNTPRTYHTNKQRKLYLFEYRGHKMLEYSGMNQTIYVGKQYGSEVTVNCLATSNDISISITVKFASVSTEPKGRGVGVKAVLHDAKKCGVTVVEPDGTISNTEVLLGSECLKGNAARLHQFAEAVLDMEGPDDMDRSVLLYGHGHEKGMAMLECPEIVGGKLTGKRVEVDLLDDNNMFTKWWKDNTKQYTIYDKMSVPNFLFKLFGLTKHDNCKMTDENIKEALNKLEGVNLYHIVDGAPVITDRFSEALEHGVVSMWDAEGSLVNVCETFKGVKAPYVFQIELASSVECSNPGQSATIQQIGSLYAMNPELGTAVANETIEQEDSIVSLVSMATNTLAINKQIKDQLQFVGYKDETANFNIGLNTIASFNNSMLAMGWNKIYDQHNDPFLAFFEDTGKKFAPQCLVNRIDITEIKQSDYTVKQAVEGSNRNYTINVGTGYNMASVATFMAIKLRHQLETIEENHEQLFAQFIDMLVVVGLTWKTIYENSALASYNKKGSKLFNLMYSIHNDGDYSLGEGSQMYQLKDLMLQIEGIENKEAITDRQLLLVMDIYYKARMISAVENHPKAVSQFLVANANIKVDVVGAALLRRIDQGKYANNPDNLNYLNEDAEKERGSSFFKLFIHHNDENGELMKLVCDQVPNWLKRKFIKAAVCHNALANFTKVTEPVDENEGSNFKLEEGYSNRVISIGDGIVSNKYLLLDHENKSIYTPVLFAEKCSNTDTESLIHNIPAFYEMGELIHTEGVELPVATPHFMCGAFITQLLELAPLDEKGNVVPEVGFNYKNYGGEIYKHRNLTAKEIIILADKRYPEGVIINSMMGMHDLTLYISFKALLKAGAFSSSGAATGIANTVAELLRTICAPINERDKRFNTQVPNMIKSIQAKLKGYVRAGLIKHIGKGKKSKQGSKVMTNHHMRYLTTPNGKIVPTFAMNPHDEVVKAGNYKHGSIVSISRTPMIAKTFGILLLDNSVDIGHLEVCDMIFALTNRGDGDGDPVDILLERHLTDEEMEVLGIQS